MPLGTLRTIAFEDALASVSGGAAFVDLRPPIDYFDVHLPGSLCLLYERGPGMASRARDCLPLGLELIVLDLGYGDVDHAAASLRGKGFDVLGVVTDALNEWGRVRGTPASTETVASTDAVERTILDVGDPGGTTATGSTNIPVERLWNEARLIDKSHPVAVIAGAGVRAALAVGILEYTGVSEVSVYRA